jgi:predicted Zn-dependent protease
VNGADFPAVLVEPVGTIAADELVVESLSEADARYLRGDLFAKLGSNENADEEIAKALKADPSHVDARILRAEIRLKEGKKDEAISLLQDVVTAQPSSFRGQYALAAAFLDAKRYEDAQCTRGRDTMPGQNLVLPPAGAQQTIRSRVPPPKSLR